MQVALITGPQLCGVSTGNRLATASFWALRTHVMLQAAMRNVKRRRVIDQERENQERRRLERNSEAQVGDPGYQYHAKVPRQARPDYIRAPASAVVVRFPTFPASHGSRVDVYHTCVSSYH